MSEQEENNRIAELVKEHARVSTRLRELEKEINATGAVIASVGSCMQIDRGHPSNASHLSTQLAKLPPGGISPDQIRAWLAEHAEVSGKLLSIRSQLTPYDFKF